MRECVSVLVYSQSIAFKQIVQVIFGLCVVVVVFFYFSRFAAATAIEIDGYIHTSRSNQCRLLYHIGLYVMPDDSSEMPENFCYWIYVYTCSTYTLLYNCCVHKHSAFFGLWKKKRRIGSRDNVLTPKTKYSQQNTHRHKRNRDVGNR